MHMFKLSRVALLGLMLLAGCPKKNADIELAAADKALADAAANRAKNCAGETYTAAENMLAEAKKAAKDGDMEGARTKAAEAERLAGQAKAASPEGCDKKKDENPDLNKNASSTDNAGRGANLGSLAQTIYFDYNDANIREDSKALLTQVAAAMVKDPGVKVEIEGHCDERGSTEYNLSLGERRAKAVEKYLLTQGVKGGQISTISYGEERPVDPESNEAAWAKNRRAEIKPQR
ncbi:MAG: peptidoglycan-associated lipoprotein Pal [Myxococcota bacterium]